MAKVNLKLVTPEKVVFEEDFDSLSVDTALGQITVLPNHAPLVSALVPGEMITKKDGQTSYLHISGGFVTVEQGSKVVILADAAEHDYEIDEKRANEAKARAQNALRESVVSAEEIAETEAALARSLARLKVIRRRGRKGTHAPGQPEHIESIQ